MNNNWVMVFQEDIEVLGESSSRPRRAVRTTQAAKGTKPAIPKAVGLPKPTEPTKKVRKATFHS